MHSLPALALALALLPVSWLAAAQLATPPARAGEVVRLGLGCLILCALVQALLLLLPATPLRWPGALLLMAAVVSLSLWLAARRCLLPARWRLPLLLPLTLAPLLLAMASPSPARLLWQSLSLALACSMGFPAFAALARQLDDSAVPARLRPLPVRLLACAVLSLALAGLGQELA